MSDELMWKGLDSIKGLVESIEWCLDCDGLCGVYVFDDAFKDSLTTTLTNIDRSLREILTVMQEKLKEDDV